MFRASIVGLTAGILAVLLATSSPASLHHPDNVVSATIPIDDKTGQPEVLPFEEFARRRVDLRNIGNADWSLVKIDLETKQPVIDPKTKEPKLSERGVVDDRIKKALAKKTRTQDENVALAVDYLRFGRPDDAQGALKGPQRDFLPNITLAHVAIAQGQWPRAFDFLDIANSIADDKRKKEPFSLPGVPPQKLAWQLKMNRGPLMKFVRLRLAESRGPKHTPETELPDDLFGVKFVNDAGAYEPGVLAAAEKAKLPGGDFTEAIAIVQQLVLWFPFDVRLHWLLGELYAAKGEFQAAKKIMDECVDSGRYSNRKTLMEHREAVTRAAYVPPTPDPPDAVPFSFGAIWIYLGVVGAIALFALARAIWKWRSSGKK